MEWLAYSLDILIIAVVVVSAFISYRRGFIQSIVRLVSYAISLVGAFFLSKITATFLAAQSRDWVFNLVQEKVGDKIADTGADIGENIRNVLESLPEIIRNFSNKYIGTGDDWITSLITSAQSGVNGIAEQLTDTIIIPMLTTMLQGVLFAIIFIILLLILNVVSKSLDIINKVPGIGGANRILGLVLGLLQAVIIVFIIVTIIQAVLAYTPISIDVGIIYPFLSQINPISF